MSLLTNPAPRGRRNWAKGGVLQRPHNGVDFIMTNVAVIGSGYWGKNLVRNFNELGALHTICDSNPETLRFFKEKYPEKEFQTSFDAVLQNPDISG